MGRTRHIPTGGTMAFDLKNDLEAERVWSEIPSDTHILVTHGPAHGSASDYFYGMHLGCPVLTKHVTRVRPLVHVVGHVHPPYGSEVLQHDSIGEDGVVHHTLSINCAIGHTMPFTKQRQPMAFELPFRDTGEHS